MSDGQKTWRVLICDDSGAFGEALSRFLERDEGISVVGVAQTADDALDQLADLSPDLVTMDLEMPGMGGVEAITRIMKVHPVPIVVLSAHVGTQAETVAQALAAGALEALPKSDLHLDAPEDVWANALRSRIKRLASVQIARSRRGRPSRGPKRPRSAAALRRQGPVQVIAIGASTGGPPALEAVLAGLPADFQVPVIVVQHMAAGFMGGLVQWLDRQVALPLAFAVEGAKLGPGVWFAQDDKHLLLDSGLHFRFDSESVIGQHRPAVDATLGSVASAAGAAGVGVVLTGMGRDGANGTAEILAAGGTVLAQDEASSAVWGMPRAAVEMGANPVLPLSEIAGALRSLQAVEATR